MPHEPDHLQEASDLLLVMREDHRDSSSWVQRFTNRLTRLLGRPATIILVAFASALWMGANAAARWLHLPAIDIAPFPDLGLALAFIAVIAALLILSTQQHGEELAQRRAELTLQMALLSERKITRVIQLLEEQRADSPHLASRPEGRTEEMAAPVDHAEALRTLTERTP